MKTLKSALFVCLGVIISSIAFCQTKVHPFFIRGTGLNHNASRVLKIDGQTIYATYSGRGLRLTIINKSDHMIVSDQSFDTYGSSSQSNDLAASLNAVTNNQIGILTSYDAWESNVTSELEDAFQRLGLTKALATENSGSRRPYAAIFEGASDGVSSGKVIECSMERTSDQPYAQITGFIIDGSFVASGSISNALLRPQGDKTEVIVDYKGNVGIGTTEPTYKLSVNGTIRSQEVKVEASPWPDYVFSKDYELTSLAETETFIQQNGHLPEVPSAQQVSEEGISLGEMNAILLKKIEELTLHVIELDKKYQKLEKENRNLKQNINEN